MKPRQRVRRKGKAVSLKASAGGKRERSTTGAAASGGLKPGPSGGLERKPPKRRITLFLDADVLAWFKDQGRGYQTEMNRVLRGVMKAEKINFAK